MGRVDARRHVTWRWVAVAASVLIIGVPVALAGLYASGDLCEPPYGGRDTRRLTEERYENVVETVVVRCIATYSDGTEIEETRVNWLGAGAALAFLFGIFFGSAALVAVVRRKPAAIVTASCAAVCVVLMTAWFA